jgi:hypothetical protein
MWSIRRSFLAVSAVVRYRRYRDRARRHAIIRRFGLHCLAPEDPRIADARARDLLLRAESAVRWLPRPVYPTGGAAGPLLLYLLIRTLDEHAVRNVLELGAGQTTRVLDAWAKACDGRVVTFEQDAGWAAKVSAEVDASVTSILHLPLQDVATSRGQVQWYHQPPAEMCTNFDLLLVDGPVGTTRLSRLGVVDKVPDWLGQDWAIIWDDLHRAADLESFASLIERLRALGVEHDHLLLDGDRAVGVVFTPKYSAMKYMW